MPDSHEFITSVNQLLAKLNESGDLSTGLEIANRIMILLGSTETEPVDNIVDEHVMQLPNAERYDHWFQNHPWMGGERAAFEILDAKETPIQAKFYWLKKRSRQFIAGGVHFTENWEDAPYTQNDNFKIGIDFFLAPDGKSLLVTLSNKGNLRIVELQHKLNNTQVEIFTKWRDAVQVSSVEALHTSLWDSFMLQSVNEEFYKGVSNSFTELLQHLKDSGRDEEPAKLFSSRLLGRLLFVWFLRKKNIIDESTGYFDSARLDATNYYRQSLEQLFFHTLNIPIDERDKLNNESQRRMFPEPDDQPQANLFKVDQKTPYLNGGLFEAHENDWYGDLELTFPDGYFTNLYEHFNKFNFTTDESTPEYEQVAIDPEMLGRVFESLLATQIDESGKKATKAKGTFYTPREIVSYMCKEALRNYLYSAVDNDTSIKTAVDGLLDTTDSEWAKYGTNSRRDTVKNYRTDIMSALDGITILDPACGSGAFPMGMLQLLIKTYERLEGRFDPYKTKLQIIQNNIFGVDIEPMAVEISRLRAWLSLIVDEEDSSNVEPLPNLDFKFVCANSLMPLFEDKQATILGDIELHSKLKDLRAKYFNARKLESKKKLQKAFHTLINQKTIFDDRRTQQLQSFNPFKNSYPADFFNSDQMFGVTQGFDIVIGNPPYGAKVPDSDKKAYQAFYNSAKTISGVQKGSSDTYSLFIDLGLFHAIREKGVLCYIVPLAFTSSESMTGLHSMMLKDCEKIQVSTYSNRPKKIFDNADQRVSIVLANKTGTPTSELLTTGVIKRYATTSVREIIDNLHFVNSLDYVRKGRLPKIGQEIELNILQKIFEHKKTLLDFTTKVKNENIVYYRTAGGRYYHVITNYPTGSTQEKALYLKDDINSAVVGAILSSNLYFWLSQAYSDNLHLKEYEITMLPIPDINTDIKDKLSRVYTQYAEDIEKNSIVKKGNYNTISEFKEYRIRESKKIIDEFDRILQQAYGLTDEETDFLINYELEFRTDTKE